MMFSCSSFNTAVSNQVFGTRWGLSSLCPEMLVTLRSEADLCEDLTEPPSRARHCGTL